MPKNKKIWSDPDFIIAPKYQNSLNKMLKDHPNGVPTKVICKALQITPEELQSIYDSAILKLQKALTNIETDE